MGVNAIADNEMIYIATDRAVSKEPCHTLRRVLVSSDNIIDLEENERQRHLRIRICHKVL